MLAADRARMGRPEEMASTVLAENHVLAKRAACESAVLLKNERAALPLKPAAGGTIAVIGRMATAASLRYQGAGSSAINAHTIEAPLDAIESHIKTHFSSSPVTLTFAPGYAYDPRIADPASLEQATAAAAAADVALVFVGLPAAYEVEGVDREHMGIPQQMVDLVQATSAANPHTVVVLLGGAPMELPWEWHPPEGAGPYPAASSSPSGPSPSDPSPSSTADAAPSGPAAILWVGLGGQAIGSAISSLLFGVCSPSGKLAETWPRQLTDVPAHAHFGPNGASLRQVVYREALNVGYRYLSLGWTLTRA
uniref:beta-glucosidase n=1 Tax=Haptolina brevifila TaxID=156173 RepID=A0A7S2BG58_9EUKA